MSSQHLFKRPDYNYCKQTEPVQENTDKKGVIPSEAADIPEQLQKPVTEFKMNAPFRASYPKRSEVTEKPVHDEVPKQQEAVNSKDKPNSDHTSDKKTITPTKPLHPAIKYPKAISTKPNALGHKPSHSNSSSTACKDEWWLKYDEYLSKFLK